MKGLLGEKSLHIAFEASLVLKGAFAVAEIAAGLFTFLITPQLVLELVQAITRAELTEDPRDFVITREDGDKWRVSGAAIERAAKMTYWEHDGSLRRFQKIMETLGVDEALRNAGVQEGDTVAIGDFELEWQE